MAVSKETVMAIKSYQNQAENLVKNHLLSDPIIPYTSIVAGMLVCKVIYNLTQLFSALYFKSYACLNRVQRIEWNNRGISTVHAFFIAAMSLYFVFWSDLYADYQTNGYVTFRNSTLSTFTLGVSVGYFIADLAMILWLYPSLGGIEYVVHHSLQESRLLMLCFRGKANFILSWSLYLKLQH
ncbi:Transmembrane protein 56 [Bienertia sinuspersici]